MMMKNKIIVLMINVCVFPLHSMIPLEVGYGYSGLLCPSIEDSEDLYNKRVNLKNVDCLHPERVSLIDSSIIVKTLPMEKRIGVCYDYAMRKILRNQGIDLDFPIVGCEHWVDRLSFFKPIKNIKKNDLAVYIDSLDHLFSPHFGVVKGRIGDEMHHRNIIIKSKWGTFKAVFTHSLFDLPVHWGNGVIFFRLKKEYRDTGSSKHRLLTSIMYDQSLSLHAQKFLAERKLELFDLAGQAAEQTNRLQYLITTILEQCPFISIDEQDRFGNTPLIKAVQNNNRDTVQLLRDYGANVFIKNVYGHTALMIAQSNNNAEIMQLLLDCDSPE